MKNVWSKISLYESKDLVSKFYEEKHDRELSAGKAEEIVSHITQGREYFSSAKQADNVVSPLLFYYGVVAFCRGLILFLDPFARVTSLKPSHGLRVKNWTQKLSDGIEEVPNLNVEITSGTFSKLWEVTENIERSSIYIAPYPNRTKIKQYGGKEDSNNLITIKEILARIPELQNIYENTFDDYSKCYNAIVFCLSEQTDIAVLETSIGLPNKELVRDDFGLPKDIKTRKKEKHNFAGNLENISFRIIHSSNEEFYNRVPFVKNDRKNNIFAVAPLADNLNFSSLLTIYIISYAIGMLVRYYPTHWMSMITSSKGDFSYPLLKEAIAVIEYKFPKLIIEEIERR
ncbi:YaaC family protein [Halanaerobacter jeridensis]|uniref:YaaC-like protein n=1 Tax=Halanaerobacter jeridensis TaxID=706427 RepID=A0A938XRW8_9FIRM|nr:YaaC family protein [Halanaerobacter jeridensis]MBM7556308.1 hypothetical protein [Halanaerobacter jeridensis]